MRGIAGFAVAAVLSVAGTALAGEPASDIAVFVAAGDGSSGFVSPDLKDSARHLVGALKKKKGIRLVEDRSSAEVVVRIDKRFLRDTGSRVGSATATDSGAVGAQTPVEEQVINATLIVGEYSTEIVGANWWSWKSAAGSLASAVEKWIRENRAQLLSRRSPSQ